MAKGKIRADSLHVNGMWRGGELLHDWGKGRMAQSVNVFTCGQVGKLQLTGIETGISSLFNKEKVKNSFFSSLESEGVMLEGEQ